MHPPILEVRGRRGRIRPRAAVGLAALCATLGTTLPAAAAAPARPECPASAERLVEHFIGADCTDCWDARPAAAGARAAPGSLEAGPHGWTLDWLVPSAAGEAAPLAPAALAESAQRLARLGPYLGARLQAAPAGFDSTSALVGPDRAHRLWVHSSLPFKGYFGVQVHARGRWSAGSSGWVGLVELVPAGTDGSPIARHVVRVLTGPLALPASAAARDRVDPLFALRWPEAADPSTLIAVAWIEDRAGRILQITSDRCPDPR